MNMDVIKYNDLTLICFIRSNDIHHRHGEKYNPNDGHREGNGHNCNSQ